jgi:hypothetical protein
MFPFVSLAGLVAASSVSSKPEPVWSRLFGSGVIFLALTPAFSGYFGGLLIQIADAPYLAGLVVDRFTFEWTGGLILLSLLMLAFFPRFAKYAVAASMTFTLSFTGFHAQDQFISFRGANNTVDSGAQQVKRILSESQLSELRIVANSNFDARLASFWLDGNFELDLVPKGVDASQYVGQGGTVLLVGSFATLPETPSFEVDGMALFLAEEQ